MLIKTKEELEKLLNIHLTKKQIKVFNRRELYILWGGSQASGKSFLISFIALYYALKYNEATCLIGRKFHVSLTKTTQVSFENLLKKLPKNFLIRHNKTEGYYEFRNGSKIFFVGLVDSYESLDKIRGIELIFAAIDEAQDLDDNSAFKMISGRLRQVIQGVKPRLLLSCNPTRKKWIRELFIDHNLKDFYFLKALPRDNPYLIENYIKNQKRVLSEVEFKTLILGSWEDAQTLDCLFNKEKIDKAIENEKYIKGNVAYGLDVSLRGTTVLAKKDGNKITIPLVMNNSKLEELIEKIKENVQNEVVPINIDAVGEGSGLALVLEREGLNIVRINQSELADDSDRYLNSRAENYDRLNKMLDENLNLPHDNELINQMLNTKKRFSKDNKIKLESKAELHKRKESPDKLDAVVLSCIGGVEQIFSDQKGSYQIINGRKVYDKYAHNSLQMMAENGEISRNEAFVNLKTLTEHEEYQMQFSGGLRLDWRERRKVWDEQIERWKRSGEYSKEFIRNLKFIKRY